MNNWLHLEHIQAGLTQHGISAVELEDLQNKLTELAHEAAVLRCRLARQTYNTV